MKTMSIFRCLFYAPVVGMRSADPLEVNWPAGEYEIAIVRSTLVSLWLSPHEDGAMPVLGLTAQDEVVLHARAETPPRCFFLHAPEGSMIRSIKVDGVEQLSEFGIQAALFLDTPVLYERPRAWWNTPWNWLKRSLGLMPGPRLPKGWE